MPTVNTKINSKRKMIKRNKILNNDNPNCHGLVNKTVGTNSKLVDSTNVFYNKTKHEEVIIDDGALMTDHSVYETVVHLIMRLSSRWTPSEVEYLESTCNAPVTLFNDDGKDNMFYPISYIQRMTKLWRKEIIDNNNRVMTLSELSHVEKLLAECKAKSNKTHEHSANQEMSDTEEDYENKNDKVSGLSPGPSDWDTDSFRDADPSEIQCHFVSTELIADLPSLNVSFQNKDGSFTGFQCCPDTGSQISLMSVRSMEKLGFSVDDIDKTHKLSVSTASGKGNQAKGTKQLKMFIRGDNNNYYYIIVNFVIFDGPISRVLLGRPALLDLDHKWECKNKIESLTIDVFDKFNKKRRKRFTTMSNKSMSGITVNNIDSFLVGPQPNEQMFVSEHPVDPNRFRFESPVEGVSVKASDKQPIIEVEQDVIGFTKWPGKMSFMCYLVVSSGCERNVPPSSLPVNVWFNEEEESTTDSDEFDDNQIIETAEFEDNDDVPTLEPIDTMAIDKIAVCPSDEQTPEGEKWFLPDMDHVPEDVRRKFEVLFEQYKHVFSKGKFDISRARVPPVSIDTIPGRVATDKCAKHTREESQLIQEYIDEMIASGQVEELGPNEHTNFNHRLLLVYRQDPTTGKKFCSSKADKLVGEARHEALRKSSRLVSDMKSLNEITLSTGRMHLQQLPEMLPLMAKRCVSVTDIRSGYSNILIDRQSSLKTAFIHRDKKYIYLVLPQGLSISPERFQIRVSYVLNQNSFNDFMKENECSLDLKYFTSLIIYQDDLAILGINYQQHYFIWKFVLEMFSRFGFKLNAKKTNFLKPKVDFLGYEIRPQTGQYSLTSERKSAFKSWAFRPERQYIVSRLCTLNYFSNCLVGFKQITACLHVLCKQKVFHVKKIHAMEWSMMRLILDLEFTFYIPDMNKPLILCSDASFSCAAGAVMQYHPGHNENSSELQLCAVSTKQFGSQDMNKSIVFKEVMSLIHCVETHKHWIRSCHRQVIVFTDASSLQFLHRLKDSNSRIYHFSLLLSSYDNLHIFWTKGSYLNAIADNLSRCLAGLKINNVAALPAKYVENLPPIFMRDVIIGPETLHAICQQKLPSHFSDVPERHRQQYAPMKSEKELIKLIDAAPPEKQILDAIYYGYKSIKPDTTVFVNEKTNRLISQTDFNTLATKLKFHNIKDELDRITCESYHVTDVIEILPQMKQFVLHLNDFISNNGLQNQESVLFKETNDYLGMTEPEFTMFTKIVDIYQRSSLYNTTSPVESELPTLFVPLVVKNDSAVKWTVDESCSGPHDPNEIMKSKTLSAALSSEKLIPSNSTIVIKVKSIIKTKHSVSCDMSLPANITGEIISNLYGLDYEIKFLVLHNSSATEVLIDADLNLINVTVHVHIPKVCSCDEGKCHCKTCSCQTFRDISFVETKCHEYSDYTLTHDVRVLLTETFKNIPYNTQCNNVDAESDETPLPDEPQTDDNTLMAVNPENKELVPAPPNMINRLILSGLLLYKNQIFSKDILLDLQRSSAFYNMIFSKLKNGEVKNFHVDKSGLLMFQDSSSRQPRLCIDDITTKMMFQSLHQKDYHLTDQTSVDHFNEFFFNKNVKLIVRDVKLNCSVCFFNQSCRRSNYVNNPSENQAYRVMEKIHCDCIENLPLSVDGYKFIILYVDVSTGFTIAESAKSLAASEITKITDRFFRYFGTPAIMKTDFGPCFRSNLFMDLLKKMEVKHEKSCPRRPESNGLVEIIVRNYRDALTKVIMSHGYNQRNKWPMYLTKTSLFFNNAPLHSRLNKLSRLSLFFNSNRFTKPSLYNVNESDELLTCLQQQKALQKIWEAREKHRQHYDSKTNAYVPNMLVSVSLSKQEQPIVASGTAIQPNLQDVKSVTKIISPTSCQLKSRYTGDLQTYDIANIRPINLNELSFCFGKDLLEPSSFEKNIYKPGRRTTILSTIQDLHKEKPLTIDDEADHNEENIMTKTTNLDNVENDTENSEITPNYDESHDDVDETEHNRILRPREKIQKPLKYRSYNVSCRSINKKGLLKPERSFELKQKYATIFNKKEVSFSHTKEICPFVKKLPSNVTCHPKTYPVPMTFSTKYRQVYFTRAYFEPGLTRKELNILY